MIERWLKTFQNDPQGAIEALMSGRAGIGADLRLDIPELLHHLFADGAERASERARLDTALYGWLLAMRSDYTLKVERIGFASYGRRLIDALVTLRLLDLPIAREHIRADLDAWIRWLAPLRVAPERDPALECWRLLAEGQRDQGLVAAWLRLAADPRREYLDAALSGLERVPTGGEIAINRALMLRALLTHAVRRPGAAGEAKAIFERRFAALRGLMSAFPGSPQSWRDALTDALDSFELSDKSRKASELVSLIADAQKKRTGAKRGRTRLPVPLHIVNSLHSDIERSGDSHENVLCFFQLTSQNRVYTEQTGDSYAFTRSLSRLGNALLRRGGLDRNAIDRLGTAIEHALFWDPMNSYIWMLWAKWFAIQGRNEAREWTLRETVRLLPDHGPSRVELARLLIRRGEPHWDEAERWLREAAERNPGHEPSRVELARLLIRRGDAHWDEAERWLREAADRNPGNEHSRVELARLLIRRGEAHWDEAERWLREAADRNPGNAPCRVILAALLMRSHRTPDAIRMLDELLAHHPTNSIALMMQDRLLGGLEIDFFAINADLDAGDGDSELAGVDQSFAASDESEPRAAGTATDPERGGSNSPMTTESAAASIVMESTTRGSPELTTPGSDVEQAITRPPKLTDSEDAAEGPEPRARMSLTEEIERRGRLSAEFRSALAAFEHSDVADIDLIRQQAHSHDTLAGFYLQWLSPDNGPEPPPNAWSWNACRLWQDRAPAEEWSGLERRSAEFAAETSFLGWLAGTTDDGRDRWLARFSDDGAASWPPRLRLMRARIEDRGEADAVQSNELALALLSSAALAPPEFVVSPS